jgi:BON domain
VLLVRRSDIRAFGIGRERTRSGALWAFACCAIGALASLAQAQPARTYQLDPFGQASSGFADCPPGKPPLLTEEQMRIQAHERAERGTSCCLAGTCECGGAYKHDPEINARVAAAILADKRFAGSSVWVTTMRGFVTLQGCVSSATQKRALEALVKHQQGVALVWNETKVTARPR